MADPSGRKPDEPRPEVEWPAEDLAQAHHPPSRHEATDRPAEAFPPPPAAAPPVAAPTPVPPVPPLPPAQPAPPPLPPAFRGPPPIMAPAQPGPYALQPEPTAPTPPSAGDKSGVRDHFRPDIEGLRAVAVIAVLLFHIGLPGAGGGFIGVDVFYVISGFLITGLLLREGEATGKVDLIAFYARRMRRLLPAALVVIVVTLAVSAAVLSPLRLTEVAGDAAAAALYVSNFRFALEATDYLSVTAPSPFLHYWSLGVEEQFYLAWPLIMLVAVRLLSLRFVGWFLLVLAVASFGISLYWTDAAPAWAFFSPVTRAWELAAGALLAVDFLRIPHRAPRLTASLVVWLGLALIAIGVVVISTETQFPGLAAILPVLGAVLVILGGIAEPTLPGRLLANPLARYIGRISYSLYLWHWSIIILVPIAIGEDSLTLRLALGGAAVLAAMISTEIIEQPFRRGRFLARRPRFSVQLGLASSVAVGVAALLMSGAITIPTPWIRPDPVVVELASVREDLPRSYADGCHLGYEVTQPADCVYGDTGGAKTAFLLGDSHAAQWLPALDAYARQKGWRLEVHTKSSCSPVPLELWERRLRRVYDECFEWRDAVMKRIRKTNPEVVFVGSSRDYEIQTSGGVAQTREAYAAWQAGLTTALRDLGDTAKRVVLLAETPFLNYDPVDCLADPKVSSCDPPTDIVIDRGWAALEIAAADASGAGVLTVNELLCPGLTCPVVVDETVVFRDQHHVTATYMTQLAEPIGNLLEGRAPFPTPSPDPDTTTAGG